MKNGAKYYIVEASALPEVFLKVAEAKRLLATGEASTVNEAAKMTDISRSAFYKYREAVQPFRNMNTKQIITFQFLLRDEPGALSAILAAFAQQDANFTLLQFQVGTVQNRKAAAVVAEGQIFDIQHLRFSFREKMMVRKKGAPSREVMAPTGRAEPLPRLRDRVSAKSSSRLPERTVTGMVTRWS